MKSETLRLLPDNVSAKHITLGSSLVLNCSRDLPHRNHCQKRSGLAVARLRQ